ncbi:hypothetical protein PAPYR_10258 [Paratrimastix pyriformis]|uniref:Uncharacterized protein n=1 Tax=Paratrimastix pyriformis TaxID=342808 RepID=A0ABQ8U906_9EUKA|nr:hypothetical protein PAPYR_10258 [Paratrimastix pyriformis]
MRRPCCWFPQCCPHPTQDSAKKTIELRGPGTRSHDGQTPLSAITDFDPVSTPRKHESDLTCNTQTAQPTRSTEVRARSYPDILTRLPPDILSVIMEASASHLHSYLLLMGLSHATRTAVRGTPRELSFLADGLETGFDVAPPILAVDTLAAIVGPCKGLVKLTLPSHYQQTPFDENPLGLVGCGLTDAACQPWVDAAFAGHSRLAVLHIPGGKSLWPAIRLILAHLPGLVELHFLLGGRDLPPSFLAVLAQSCPGLQTLRLSPQQSPLDFAALSPLGGTLRDLSCQAWARVGSLALAALAPHLISLERLKMGGDQLPVMLRHLPRASAQLTHLTIMQQSGDPDGEALCLPTRLVDLRWDYFVYNPGHTALIARMLAANQATLRSVSLALAEDDPGPLMAALGRLAQLTSLELRVSGRADWAAVVGALPSRVLNQLECLALYGSCNSALTISCPRLRTLRAAVTEGAVMTLACPALEELVLAGFDLGDQSLVMDCPQLRSIEGLMGTRRGLRCLTPMPQLVRAHGATWNGSSPHLAWVQDPPWLAELVAHAPRLRELVALCDTQPAGLDRLWAAAGSSLTRLEGVRLRAATPVLRLPEHLERLGLYIPADEFLEPVAELRVEAAGLRVLDLSTGTSHPELAPPLRLTLACPALAALHLATPTLTAFRMAEGTDPPLRCLRIALSPRQCSLDAASLLAVLERHGAHLDRIALPVCAPAWHEAWPQLAAALGRLPRLASLQLGDGIPLDLTLTLPRLRRLDVHMVKEPLLRSLVLDCPLLEDLQAQLERDLERFELVGAVPNLRRISYAGGPWAARLRERFPAESPTEIVELP